MKFKSNSIIKCSPFSPTFIYIHMHNHTHDCVHSLTKAHPQTFLSAVFFFFFFYTSLSRAICSTLFVSVICHFRHVTSLASEKEFWLCLSYLATPGTITVSKETGCTQTSLGLICIFVP